MTNPTQKKFKIIIGIPSIGYIRAETMTATIEAMSWVQNCDFIVSAPTGCYIHQLREFLAESALQMKATHLLFIDSDMTFEPEGIKKLLESAKPVIGADYHYKLMPKMSVTKIDPAKVDQSYLEDDPNQPGVKIINAKIPQKPFEVLAVGTGFMLIETWVFEKLKKPWFWFDIKDEKLVGEDMYFCEKVRQTKIGVWCNPAVEVGHIGNYVY